MKPITLILIVSCFITCCASQRFKQLPKPGGRYAPAIYATASAGFSSDRTLALKDIASSKDITEDERIYLLEVLRVTVGFSSDKKEVLLSLLAKNSTTTTTKKRMSEMLPAYDLFSSDAKAVPEALAN